MAGPASSACVAGARAPPRAAQPASQCAGLLPGRASPEGLRRCYHEAHEAREAAEKSWSQGVYTPLRRRRAPSQGEGKPDPEAPETVLRGRSRQRQDHPSVGLHGAEAQDDGRFDRHRRALVVRGPGVADARPASNGKLETMLHPIAQAQGPHDIADVLSRKATRRPEHVLDFDGGLDAPPVPSIDEGDSRDDAQVTRGEERVVFVAPGEGGGTV